MGERYAPHPLDGGHSDLSRSVALGKESCGGRAPRDRIHLRALNARAVSDVHDARGIKAYGLLPFPLEPPVEEAMHGNDERLPLVAFGFGVRFVTGIAEALAVGR